MHALKNINVKTQTMLDLIMLIICFVIILI